MAWRASTEGEVPTLGWYVLDWISENLAAPGKSDYEPFTPYLEQEDFILRWYEIDPETGRFKYHRGLFGRPRGHGKSPLLGALAIVEGLADVVPDGWDANGQPVGKPWSSIRTPLVHIAAVSEEQPLALDTPVRTTSGWKNVGDLIVGDEVFSSSGESVPVARVTDVMTDQQCYRVGFDDGEAVVASASHGWTVERLNAHGDMWETVTMTTAELAALKSDSRNRKRNRIRIPLVAVAGEKRHLDVSPYLLGLWLGDGAKANGSIALDWRLRHEVEALIRAELLPWEDLTFTQHAGNQGTVNVKRRDGICPRGHDYLSDLDNRYEQAGHPGCKKCMAWPRAGRNDPRKPSLRERLRDIGVLFNKHIPDDYLQASYTQRMELLRGLIDSDGWIDAKGRAGFVNADVILFDQVCDLVSSLGFRYSITDALGTARRVHFTPRADEAVAKLSHKASRQVPREHPLSRYRRMIAVDAVDSVPVKCIGIDTKDHLFLVGKRGVLTHNTKNTWQPLLEMVREGPVLDNYPGLEPLDTVVFLPKGRIEQITAAARTTKGAPVTFATLDQTEEWVPSNGGPRLAQAIRTNAAKNGGRTLESPNAFIPGEGSVAEKSAEYAADIREGRAKNPGLLYDHREAPADTDMSDEESLTFGLRVSYGDSSAHPDGCVIHEPPCPPGHVELQPLIEQVWDPASDVQQLRSDLLNQITHASDSWMSSPEWGSCYCGSPANEETFVPLADKDVIVLGFDGSMGRTKGHADATALIGCRVSDGHLFEIGDRSVWEEPRTTSKQRDADGKLVKQAWIPPAAEVDAAVRLAFRKYTVVGFYADPSGWNEYIAKWEAAFGTKLHQKVRASQRRPIAAWPRGKDTHAVEAVKNLYSAIINGECTHDGSSALTRHVLNARRRKFRTGYLLYKAFPDSPDKIDAAYAATMAWKARLDAVSAGLGKRKRRAGVQRIR